MNPYLLQILAYLNEARSHAEHDERGEQFSLRQGIAFKNVSFAYPDRGAALTGLTFSVAKGEIVGIIGPSGSGKTTTADLLLRLVDPAEGSIIVDHTDVRDISRHAWRTHVGYVAQDVVLLNDTIEQNIRFYNAAVTHEDIIKAAKQANIHDFIEALSEGYQTTIGDRGVLISGGQRQRIALARVLARKPELLVLDEATSSLDHESEQAIKKTIEALRGEITVVIIAHRATTVSNVDRLIVLRDGRIVEEGVPQELLSNSHSYFHKMVREHRPNEYYQTA